MTGAVTMSPPRSGRVPVALAAVVMLVLLLAASSLFSAASEHHARDGVAPAGVVHLAGQTFCEPGSPGHQVHGHQHGNDWAPNPEPRPGPAGELTEVALMPVVVTHAVAVTEVAVTEMPSGVDPERSGLLRV